jgi:hypothetical protein
VRVEVLKAVTSRIAIFWAVTLHSLVGGCQHFRGYKLEATGTPKTMVTTQHHIPEDSHMHTNIVEYIDSNVKTALWSI